MERLFYLFAIEQPFEKSLKFYYFFCAILFFIEQQHLQRVQLQILRRISVEEKTRDRIFQFQKGKKNLKGKNSITIFPDVSCKFIGSVWPKISTRSRVNVLFLRSGRHESLCCLSGKRGFRLYGYTVTGLAETRSNEERSGQMSIERGKRIGAR